jgi:cysteine desulfurase
MTTKTKQLHYFDHASTTPLNKEVLAAMLPYFGEKFGNPSNLYELGREARQAVSEATAKICAAIRCEADEIIYTGSATEADNLALAGFARANKQFGNRIIISSLEHKGVQAVCTKLAKEGFEIVKIRADKKGIIDLKELKSKLDEKTILVSVCMADSETGTIQPVKKIAQIVKNDNAAFHTDASQAAAHMDIDVNKLGLDLMTLSAHKLGGPKGIGALYVRNGIKLEPIVFGGGQQGRIRSGTENVPAIVGFGEAVRLNSLGRSRESTRTKKLRDRLERGIIEKIPKVRLNGHRTNRLPNFLNISILDIEGEALLLYLDELGIVVNTGSACNSENLEPSAVLTSLGNPYEFVHGSIRFTLGTNTTEKNVDYVLKHLPRIVEKLRKISPLNLRMDQKAEMSTPKAFVGRQTPHFIRKRRERD